MKSSALSRATAIAFAAVLLVACGNEKPAIRSAEPFHIAEVEAVGPVPQYGSEWQLADLQNRTRALAAYAPQTANPRKLRLRIQSIHMKNPAMSLLLADSNRMEVVGEVTSLDNSESLGTFSASVNTDIYLNGIVGAAIAASADDERVLQKLDKEASGAILEKIYGTKAWKAWTGGSR